MKSALRLIVLTVCVGLAMTAVHFYLKNFHRVDNSLPVWFSQDDPKLTTYNEFLSEFGQDQTLVLAFEVPEVFSAGVLQFSAELSQALAVIPDVTEVVSLTNWPVFKQWQDTFMVEDFIQNIPDDEAELIVLKKQALENPLMVGSVLAKQAQVLGFLIQLRPDYQAGEARALFGEINAVVKKINRQKYPHHLIGPPLVEYSFNELVIRDQRLLFPLSVLVILALLMILFRSPLTGFLALSPQLLVLCFVLGLFALLGMSMNVVSGLACCLLLVPCVANALHLLWESRDCATISTISVSKILRPCIYTSLTTIAGFLSLVWCQIPPVRHLGLFAALANVLALLLTLFVLPWLFRNPARPALALWGSARLQDFFGRLAIYLLGPHGKWVGLGMFLLLVVSSIGMTRLKTESNLFEYFKPSSSLRQDLTYVEKNLSGSMTAEIILSHPDLVIATDPIMLRAVKKFSEELLANPIVTKVHSVLSQFPDQKYFSSGLMNGAEGLPSSQAGLAQLYFLLESAGFSPLGSWVSWDQQKLHLHLKLVSLPSEQLRRLADVIRAQAQQFFNPLGVKVVITGFAPLVAELDHRILSSQMASFGSALILIALLLMLAFKSIRLGLIGLIPNVFPLLITFGLMGFAGLHLNVTTVMIAAIVLGITVDDTIYYLHHYQVVIQEGGSSRDAIIKVHRHIGPPIFYAALIIAAGFLVLLFGSLTPTIYFGVMTAFTFVVALLGEVILLPLLLRVSHKDALL